MDDLVEISYIQNSLFSIVDTVSLEHFIRIDSVNSEKSEFCM